MSVVVIGVNHRTVPLDLLERMAITDARLDKALHDLIGRPNVSEAVVLSTCNRTEVYAHAERFHGAYQDIRNFLSEMAYLPPEAFSDHLYVHYDEAAVSHLFGVTSGLDSAVLGESEIQGQVKAAWERARAEDACGTGLNLLFRHALEAGKRARTDTGIAKNVTSVSQAAVSMAAGRLGDLTGLNVLVLGAGEMGENMTTALAAAGVADLRIANRSASKADELAQRVGGRPVRLGNLVGSLADVDLLLTSTGAPTMLVEADEMASVMQNRPHRPLLIVDIAVPRDIDPAVAELDAVTLLDMDDLRAFAEAGVEGRRREVASVEVLLAEEVERYLGETSAREVAPIISGLRSLASDIRDAELERFSAKFAALDPAEREAVEALANGIVAKLLHEPTVTLKDAAGSQRGDRLVAALRDLFDLDD
ncbi:MAG TPA: glutamyl-tRNA reductase [Acidimicrobiales bacterium]|nr:glutamyl-tRNA reductase [Acidimicrobiales bacterium]